MDHTTIINSVLSFHAGCLLAAAAAFYRVGDRSVSVPAARQYAKSSLGSLKAKLRARLSSLLRPVFENTDVVVIGEILDLDGDPIHQEQVNPVGSENYRNAIDKFVDDKFDAVIDFRIIKISLSAWESAICIRSWTILSVLAWQILALVIISLIEKVIGSSIAIPILISSVVPSLIGLALFIGSTAFATHHFDRILRVVRAHEQN